ncbi:MAG: competence/damage-inducible protein A [Armatimonadetes bacterium]|nr:competence/damage-inducible protein A [Armatimonadota bacterium]
MRAEILSVGTELLLGDIVDTNAVALSRAMVELGIPLTHRVTVGDNRERLLDALRAAASRADLILTTGGLGPTPDDLTKEGIAEAFGDRLVEDPAAADELRAFFARRGVPFAANNLKQALVFESGFALPNPHGTAPGAVLEKDGLTAICLPGPPREMLPMLENHVVPYLRRRLGQTTQALHSKFLRLVGIGESSASERVAELQESENPTVAPILRGMEPSFRITARAEDRETALAMVEEMEARIRERVGEFVYGVDTDTLESVLVREMAARDLTLATAESCTGGLVGHRITNVPGSSAVFHGGVVSYANAAKQSLLGVKPETLESRGAVSEETAGEMAEGARQHLGASVGVAVTGVAGPGGGTPEKPVGLVYMAVTDGDGIRIERHKFGGAREDIKARSAQAALNLVRKRLLNL